MSVTEAPAHGAARNRTPILFLCRQARVRDIDLLRLGARNAGYWFWIVWFPFGIPLLLIAFALKLFGLAPYLLISDKHPGDRLLAWFFGGRSARMLWNYGDEFAHRNIELPRRKVCFFEEETGNGVEKFAFAPERIGNMGQSRNARNLVTFIGDIALDDRVPKGIDWWRSEWIEMRKQRGFAFYLHSEFRRQVYDATPDPALRRRVLVLAKNLLRLWIIQAATGAFGERVIVVGSNWRQFDVPCQKSAYGLRARKRFYANSAINLDCGSKSGAGSLYPRSSEIISYAGGIAQVVCSDTLDVFGDRHEDFAFGDEAQLVRLIDRRLAEPAKARQERDAWLLDQLAKRAHLMRNSFERLVDSAS